MKHSQRDVRGRFSSADTSNTPESADGRFETQQELDVETQPSGYAYRLVGRDESSAGPHFSAPGVRDDLGVTGQRLRSRNPVMVHADEIAEDTRDVGNELLRSAARDSGPMDRLPASRRWRRRGWRRGPKASVRHSGDRAAASMCNKALPAIPSWTVNL